MLFCVDFSIFAKLEVYVIYNISHLARLREMYAVMKNLAQKKRKQK